jgi:hypothetical protein
MIASLAVTVGLLLQAAGNGHPARANRAPAPVRIWRGDSTAYVTLREPGNLLVMHVDAIGRIQVLFPAGPDDDTGMLKNDTLVAIPLPPAAEGNPATFIAVRSRWPFEFAALREGSAWSYDDALLLQPTAGDPLGALLDIADRVTDGRPYDYAEATYSRAGSLVARGPVVPPQVCLSCVRRGTAVAEVSRGPIQTSSVDCSNASLTNSVCGVTNGNISITSAPAPAPPAQVVYQPTPTPVYVPYFVPIVVDDGLPFVHHPPRPQMPPAPSSLAQPSRGAAFPNAPRLLVPSSSDLRTLTSRRH